MMNFSSNRAGAFLRTAVLFALLASKSAFGAASEPIDAYAGKVEVRIFTMPMCPYGNEALRDLLDLRESMNDAFNLEINYVADEPGRIRPKTLRNFSSMHGDLEVVDGIVGEIVRHLYPEEYPGYLMERTKHPQAYWRACAERRGLDVDLISNCIMTDKALSWYSENIRLSIENGIKTSPTIYINDVKYDRPVESRRLALAICAAMGPKKIDCSACSNLPECFDDLDCSCRAKMLGTCDNGKCACIEEPEVVVSVLSSDKIDPVHLEPSLAEIRRLVPSVRIVNVSIESAEGMDTVKEFGAGALPLFIFDRGIVRCRNFAALFELSGILYAHDKIVAVGTPVAAPFRQYGVVSVGPDGTVLYDLSWHVRASALHALGEFEKAEGNYKAYLKENPRDSAALSNLGALYMETGDYDSAIDCLENALKIDPDNGGVYENLNVLFERLGSKEAGAYSFVQRGWALNRKSDWNRAAGCFEQALNLQKDLYIAHLGLGVSYSRMGRYSKALESLEAARKGMPEEARLLNEKGGVLWRLDRKAEAIDAYRRVLAGDPSHVAARRNLAVALRDTDRLQDAIAIMAATPKDALKTDPTLAALLVELYCTAGDASKASEVGGEMIETLGGECPELLYWTALGDVKSDKVDAAKSRLLICARKGSSDPGLMFPLGKAFLDLNMHGDSERAFLKILEALPGSAETHGYLAILAAVDREGNSKEQALSQAQLAFQFGLSVDAFRALATEVGKTHPLVKDIALGMDELAREYE